MALSGPLFIGFALIAGVVWLLATGVWRAVGYRQVARSHSGMAVVRGRSGPALNRLLDRWEDGPPRMPLWFFVVVTPTGLQFVDRHPTPLFQVDWPDVVSVTGRWIRDGQWSANGLELVFRSFEYQVELPIVVFGFGPFGLFNSTLASVKEQATLLSGNIRS